MKQKELLSKILKNKLDSLQKKNPKFSLRAFAKMLSVSPATLSRLMAGSGNPSKKLLGDLIGRLQVDGETKTKLLQAEYDPYLEINAEGDYKEFIENWYYSPIVCLAETEGFKEDSKWIADRLGIKEKQVETALETLKRIGFLKRNSSTGKLEASTVSVSTTAVKKTGPDLNWLGKLDEAKKFIEANGDPEGNYSDISSMVVPFDPKNFSEVKSRTKRFRRSLAQYMDSGKKKEVYMIFVQVIPLSKLKR